MTRRNRKKEENIQDVNSFMHEVEEAMHAEAMMNFWNAYKIHLVAGFIAIFVSVTSWQWYEMAKEKGLASQADTFWAMARSDAQIEGYADLLNNGSQGYKVLATFKTAGKQVEAGELKTALTIYDGVINGDESDDFKQLATFYKGIALLSSDPVQAEALFHEIVISEGPFIISAKEMLGILSEQKGNLPKAKKYYENIIVNPAIPQGLRSRVQSRLDFISRSNKST